MPTTGQMTDKEIREYLPDATKGIYDKYMESFNFLQARKRRQVAQIALMNNLQRGDDNISSTLLLTLFHRILSNLYDDKMQVKFVPSEELDNKKIQSLNILAQNDYREMDMKAKDYDWTWDTLFFGRGYMETLRFDTARKIMQPHVINPLAFGYDPFFEEPQQWRYYWKWITKSSQEINSLIRARIITGVASAEEVPSGIDPYLWNYKVVRDRAKFATPTADDSNQGDIHQILEYFGHDEEGNKCVYWLDKNFSKILYHSKLDLQDGDDVVGPNNEIINTNSKWPIVVKEAFREPHSSVVFSVADLLEDKHRARSVLLNLAFLAAKDKANPIYQYNPDKVRDVTQLFSRQVYQHIPVESVTDAIAPLNKDSALDPSLANFMALLNREASDPVGTAVATEPAKKGKQTATEAAIQQQMNDLAQSLQSKVMQFGVEEFWSHWYHRYKKFSKDGDEKIATIVGVKGVTFEKISLKDIQTKYPPKVMVYSAKEAEYKDLVKRRDWMQLYPVMQQTLTPDGLHNWQKHVFLPLMVDDPAVIDVLLPDSLDEIKAKEENDALDKDNLPKVSPTDNHEQHLAIHRMAQNTWGKWLHIQWHEEALGQQKKLAMAQQQMQGAPQQQGLGMEVPQEPMQPQVGVAKQNPREAASSLRNEVLQKTKQDQQF